MPTTKQKFKIERKKQTDIMGTNSKNCGLSVKNEVHVYEDMTIAE